MIRNRRHYIVLTMSKSAVKQAIYERNAGFFKEAILSRLAESAATVGVLSWRCVAEKSDEIEDCVSLVFEETPENHHETIMSHEINRLLEAHNS